MKNLNKKKKIITCSVLLFSFLSITIFANFNFEPPFYEDDANKDDFTNFPKTSDSLPSFNGTGDKVNITLHQSYLNTSTIEFTNLDNENSFTEPFPNFNGYNTSFINITMNDIHAPNKTLVVEDDTLGTGLESYFLGEYYVSFQPKGIGYLENISIPIKLVSAGNNANLTIKLYNATDDSGTPKPDSNLGLIVSKTEISQSSYYWHNFTNIHTLFNSSKTYDNTFFLRVEKVEGGAVFWDWYSDGSDADETYVYNAALILETFGINTIDFGLTVSFSPIDHIPKPSEINLQLNSTVVYDISKGSGYYSTNQRISSSTNKLNFTISADWWDVSCNITSVQINCTKTDLRANSSFEVLGNGQDVYWNVTKPGGLNYFDSRFNNYTINFTISSRWGNVQVWNSSTNRTDDIKTNYLNNYKDIQVFNAGNDNYWFLNATSLNLLDNITKYIGTTSVVDTFNYTDLVHFNGTFASSIIDGNINLSVYNPSILGDLLNYTFVNSSFGSGKDIYFGDWNISKNVTKYGDFRILTQWNNGTDAGFFRDNITILAETNLVINHPSPNTTFNSSTIFNVTITYKDIEQNLNISDGDIYYKINSGTYSSVNESVTYIGSGKYNITFDCNNTEFNYGLNTITIRANSTYYNNQTGTIDIVILGETSLTIINPSSGATLDSSNTFNITVKYNNTIRNEIIDSPNINYSLDGGNTYRWDNIKSIGDNKYNITVNCNDPDFGSYGLANIVINASKQYYYNQSESFSITITGNTALTTTKFPDPSIGYYNSDEQFNITAYFEDIGRSEGINGGQAKIYVKEVSASSYQEYTPVIIDPLPSGKYNITVDCSDPIFNPYSKYDIKINITKSHYYTAEDILGEIVVGNTTLTILAPTGTISYVENEIFDIKIEYEDHTLSSGIVGADINYTIDGTNYRWDNILDNGDGTYNITIDASDTDFGTNYGNVDIVIRANKTYYVNLTRTLTFERQITTKITPLNAIDLGSVMKGLNVSYTFNYSDTNDKPIQEVSWSRLSSPVGFIAFLKNLGNGNYTMHLDTTNVLVTGSAYDYEFNIYAPNNETQIISLTVNVLIIQTEVINVSSISEIARNSGLNQSVRFYFNDTTNTQPVLNINTGNIIVKNYATGTPFNDGEFWLFDPFSNGTYILDITMGTRNSGWYTLEINASKFPNYNWSIFYVSFYFRGNYTQLNIISVSDLEETLTPSGIGNNYTTFLGSDLTVEFNITDTEWNSNVVTQVPDGYFITFKNLKTGTTGTLQQSFLFIPLAPYSHTGDIVSSVLTDTGFYLINITVVTLNYENTTFSFNLTLVNSQINIISISNQGGQLEPSGINNFYNSSVAVDIAIEFNITDTESLNRTIARDASSYIVRFTNLDTGQNGILVNNFGFNLSTSTYNGTIITSGLPAGNYLINLSVVILNYKIIPLTFNLTIILADSNIISITNIGGQLSPTGGGGFYEPTVATDIDIEFNITDANFGNVIQIGTGIFYTIYYININTLENGTLLHSITELALSHFGSLDISSLSIGDYSFAIIINKTNNIVSYFSFNIRIVLADSNIISITNPGGQLSPSGVDSFYESFIESNINIGFNIKDANFGSIIQIGAGISYTISYINIDTSENGILLHSITEQTTSHSGFLNISLLPAGNYTFLILVEKNNNDITTLSFNLRLIEKYDVRITVLGKPDDVVAGRSFTIILEVEYFNGSAWLPLVGIYVNSTPYFNGVISTETQTRITNSTGGVSFEITVRSDAVTMNLTIQLESSYDHLGKSALISDIIIIPPDIGLTFADLLPYILIIGAVVAVAGGSLGVYRGVVVPKKREKQRILTEVKTIFDDAINLEHILVLYKGTGTCIFFKSYGSEQIDPELIGGFLSAVSSFGKEMKTQEALNEISYGDKMLLLADGEYIRVALVLGKKASLILRRHLKEFINTFGKVFEDDLPNWRGQLNPFRKAGLIVDEILNTSIILPHQISSDFSSIKELKSPHAREVLKVAHSCCEETERTFLFIATLLKETSERTNKDTAEIFIGIKELRDRKILIPIEISAIEAQPVSQQEVNLISQKVTSLTNLSNEEKQNLVSFLAELDAIEREAYLSSFTERHEIVTAPIKTTIGTTVIENQKSANKTIKELLKRAKIAKGKKNYEKAIELFQSAAVLASDWELSNEYIQIEETIRKTKIEDLNGKKTKLENEAKEAVKSKNYAEASAKYKYASKIASEIFKLGASDMTKEVKRLTKKANEYEKLK